MSIEVVKSNPDSIPITGQSTEFLAGKENFLVDETSSTPSGLRQNILHGLGVSDQEHNPDVMENFHAQTKLFRENHSELIIPTISSLQSLPYRSLKTQEVVGQKETIVTLLSTLYGDPIIGNAAANDLGIPASQSNENGFELQKLNEDDMVAFFIKNKKADEAMGALGAMGFEPNLSSGRYGDFGFFPDTRTTFNREPADESVSIFRVFLPKTSYVLLQRTIIVPEKSAGIGTRLTRVLRNLTSLFSF